VKLWIIQEVDGDTVTTHGVVTRPWDVSEMLETLRTQRAPHLGKKTAPIKRAKVSGGVAYVCVIGGGHHFRALPVLPGRLIDYDNVPDLAGLSAPRPRAFELWEFDDGTVARFSWGKDPGGGLSLGAALEFEPYRGVYEAWRGEANERQPVVKLGVTDRRPWEVG
jgi:hypothetical protein